MSNPNNTRTTARSTRLVLDIFDDVKSDAEAFLRRLEQLVAMRRDATNGAGMFSSRSGGDENLRFVGKGAEQAVDELRRIRQWLGGSHAVDEAPGESEVPVNTPE